MYYNYLFCILFIMVNCHNLIGQSQIQHMFDPIFGLEYDLKTVNFEVLPHTIIEKCNLDNYVKMWTYAHWNNSNIEYYITSGIQEVYPDGPGPVGVTTGIGLALSIRNNVCKIKTSSWILSGKISPDIDPQLKYPNKLEEVIHGYHARPICVNGDCYYELEKESSKQILDGLLSDALKRYTKAFGSKEFFMDHISNRPDSYLKQDRRPVVIQHLEQFGNGDGPNAVNSP